MSEQPFMKVKVVLEMRLYKGRLLEDVEDESNYGIFILDQFTEIFLSHDMLRDGEYIHLLEAKEINP